MKKIILFLIVALSASLFVASISLAATDSKKTTKTTSPCPDNLNRECLALENPIGSGKTGITDVNVLLGTLIKAALGIVGSLTLLMLVWGGFQWLTSAGNAEKVKKGTQTMIWAIVGVALVFSSYIILKTFTDLLTGGTP